MFMYRYPLYRNDSLPPPPKPPSPPPPIKKPPPAPPKPPPKPPQKKKKFDFKSFQKNTCSSLNDVEHFLCDFNCFLKYVKLFKLLKK